MKFEEILPALREGKKIRRKFYSPVCYICFDGKVITGFLPDSTIFKIMADETMLMQMELLVRALQNNLIADDWEINQEIKIDGE